MAVYLPIKRGDMASQVKHLMPLGYFSEREWGLPFDKVHLPGTKQMYAFGWIRYEEKDMPALRGLRENCDNKGLPNVVADEKVLSKRVKDKLRDPNDGDAIFTKDEIRLTAFKPKRDVVQKSVDYHAISSGAASVGTGGDYARWELFCADLAALTGHLTATQISEIIETGSAIPNIDCGNFLLTFTCCRHNGNYNNGYLVIVNHNAHGFGGGTTFQSSGSGGAVFKNLILRRDVNGSNANQSLINLNSLNTLDVTIENIIGNGNSKTGCGIRSQGGGQNIDLYNILVDGCTNDGIQAGNFESSFVAENFSCNNCGGGLNANGKTTEIYNGVCFNCTNAFSNIGFSTGRNNADDDGTGADGNWGTGSDNLINLTPADEVQSLVVGDGAPFLKPIKGSNIHLTGRAASIAGHTRSINNVDITKQISRGAKEIVPAKGFDPSHIAMMQMGGGMA
jgi:hypothetical protein